MNNIMPHVNGQWQMPDYMRKGGKAAVQAVVGKPVVKSAKKLAQKMKKKRKMKGY